MAPTLPAGSENQNERGREAWRLGACVWESTHLGSGASWAQCWLCDLGQVISSLYTLYFLHVKTGDDDRIYLLGL